MKQIPPSENRSTRSTLAPALVLSMAAIFGVQGTVDAASEHRGLKHAAAVGAASISNAMYEASPALEDMAGTAAGLALLLWLSRHSLNRGGSTLPALQPISRFARRDAILHVARPRKATVSFRSGGLYGP